MILETDRLLVREWTTDDAEAAFKIYGDPEVTRYLGGTGAPDPDVAHRRERLARIVSLYPEWNGLGLWAVVEKATDELIGCGELLPLDGGAEIEVGYHLRRDRWGRGYATELAQALIAHGFERLGLERIVAVAYPENAASHRVLLKAGLTHHGRRHAYGHDMEYFAIERPQNNPHPTPRCACPSPNPGQGGGPAVVTRAELPSPVRGRGVGGKRSAGGRLATPPSRAYA